MRKRVKRTNNIITSLTCHVAWWQDVTIGEALSHKWKDYLLHLLAFTIFLLIKKKKKNEFNINHESGYKSVDVPCAVLLGAYRLLSLPVLLLAVIVAAVEEIGNTFLLLYQWKKMTSKLWQKLLAILMDLILWVFTPTSPHACSICRKNSLNS